MRICFAFAAPIVSLAFACGTQPRLHEEAYVWQRAWTPNVVAAVRERGHTFDGLRVLALEIDQRGTLAVAGSPSVIAGQRVVPVIRVDGTRIVDVDALIDEAHHVLDRFRADRVNVVALEIDHDCASSQLQSYANAIAKLKASVDVPVQITALPSWAPSKSLADLVAAADAVTLQVHAIDRAVGLFDPQRARAAVDAFAKRMPANKPLWIALPAYGVDSIEGGTLWANPVDVDAFLRALERDRPAQVVGVVWFRLPVEGDGGWSYASLQSVRSGNVRVAFSIERDGVDVIARNTGTVDAIAPSTIHVDTKGFVAADGAHGYAWRGSAFTTDAAPRVKVGERVVVGWVRSEEVRVHD